MTEAGWPSGEVSGSEPEQPGSTPGPAANQFWQHRQRFAKKRVHDAQIIRALWQFGPEGPGIPPDPEPDRPTRMTA